MIFELLTTHLWQLGILIFFINNGGKCETLTSVGAGDVNAIFCQLSVENAMAKSAADTNENIEAKHKVTALQKAILKKCKQTAVFNGSFFRQDIW